IMTSSCCPVESELSSVSGSAPLPCRSVPRSGMVKWAGPEGRHRGQYPPAASAALPITAPRRFHALLDVIKTFYHASRCGFARFVAKNSIGFGVSIDFGGHAFEKKNAQ